MGHSSSLIQLIGLQLLVMFCMLGGGEREPNYTCTASVLDFDLCNNLNLATFWKNAFLLRGAKDDGISTLSEVDFNITESDLKAQDTHQNKFNGGTMRHGELL